MNGTRAMMMSAIAAASFAWGTTSSSALNLPKPSAAPAIEQSVELSPIILIGGGERSMMKHRHGHKMMKRGHRMMEGDMSRGRRGMGRSEMRRGGMRGSEMRRGMRGSQMRGEGMRGSEMRQDRMGPRTNSARRVTPQGNPSSAGGSPRASQ